MVCKEVEWKWTAWQSWWTVGFVAIICLLLPRPASAQSVAQQWNEALLDAIRIDFPAPTVHSRNLYHTSAAMYDAWATYDAIADGHFYAEKQSTLGIDVGAARNEAISYAAYRVLSSRYALATDPDTSQARFDQLMDQLGYDRTVVTTEGNTPAAVGNRIAQQILAATFNDGSNEANGYVDDTGYVPTNTPMTVDYPGITSPGAGTIQDPNRWQPLFINSSRTQNGLVGKDLQEYVGPHWGDVTTFAMGKDLDPGAQYSWSDMDPGTPPLLGGEGDAVYRADTVALIRFSSSLDPTQGPGAELINISPSVNGNRPLGTHDSQGYSVNPATGQPYADNFVVKADYGRILAEFWADGPASETPPGHWNVLANEVTNHPLLEKRLGGVGPELSDLEWDVKLYLSLNGAVHDAAVAAWGVKREYDYVRPITKIRYQGHLGQSSDASLPSYHPDGLPLEDGLIELVTAESIAVGGRHRNAYINANRDADGNFQANLTEQDMIGKVVIQAWNHEPDDPETELSGVAWILAENWVPYQQDNFVTPAFAAYVSGHSTFSRAAAEVLANFTGSEYFPGGLGEAVFDVSYLDFEKGPTEEVTLQWATYFDAADEAGISRLWGGIHVSADDFQGRILGSQIGQDAFALAMDEFVSDELTWHNRVASIDVNNDGVIGEEDVLRVIDELNTHVFTDDSTGMLPLVDGVPAFFLDANADGYCAPFDALMVINYLNGIALESSSATHAIPEPTTATLVAMAGLWLAAMRSRRGYSKLK